LIVSCWPSLKSANTAPFNSSYTSNPVSLKGVPSGNSPMMNAQMLVSRCFPSTTSIVPFSVSFRKSVGMGTLSSSDSISRDAVRVVHTYSRW